MLEENTSFGECTHKLSHMPAMEEIEVYPPSFAAKPAPAPPTTRLNLHRRTGCHSQFLSIIANNIFFGSKHPLLLSIQPNMLSPFPPISIIHSYAYTHTCLPHSITGRAPKENMLHVMLKCYDINGRKVAQKNNSHMIIDVTPVIISKAVNHPIVPE